MENINDLLEKKERLEQYLEVFKDAVVISELAAVREKLKEVNSKIDKLNF